MTEPRYPSPTENFRISHTTLQSYLLCGVRWQFEQEERHRRATIPMVIGSATAAAAQADNRSKIDLGEPAPLGDLVELGVATYEREVEECEVEASPLELAAGKDDAAGASRVYGEKVSPTVRPVLCEEPVIAVIDDGVELAGTLDVAEADSVRDLKTGRQWSHERVARSRQLTGYSLLFEARFERLPARVAIDSVYRDNRKAWRSVTIWSERTERQRLAFIETVRRAREAMDAGVALPAPEGAWQCSERWCPFFRRCTARPHA